MKNEKIKTAEEILEQLVNDYVRKNNVGDNEITFRWIKTAFKEGYKTANQPTEGLRMPTKDEAVDVGFTIAKNADYNFRKVLSDPDHDIYYSGWMDCFDWIKQQIQSLNQK